MPGYNIPQNQAPGVPGSAYPQGGYPPLQPQPQYGQPLPQQPYDAYWQQGAYPQGGYADYGTGQFPPIEPQKPKRRGSRVLFWVLVVVLVLALSLLAYIGLTYWMGQQAYDQVAEHAQVEGDDLAAFDVDWDALRAINSDVVGWVYVPGTNVNYPIAWRENDTEYYLWHNFNGDTSPTFGAEYGCPALSGANNPLFTDDINIISGHNLFNGEMFSVFSTFNDSAVFNEHRTIFVLTPNGNYRLRTFAVDYVSGYGTVPIRFKTTAEMHEFMQQCVDDTLVDAEPPVPDPKRIDRAFAFYTCDNTNDAYRFFVFAAVEEYLPLNAAAEGIGGNLASDEDVNAVNDAAGKRTR